MKGVGRTLVRGTEHGHADLSVAPPGVCVSAWSSPLCSGRQLSCHLFHRQRGKSEASVAFDPPWIKLQETKNPYECLFLAQVLNVVTVPSCGRAMGPPTLSRVPALGSFWRLRPTATWGGDGAPALSFRRTTPNEVSDRARQGSQWPSASTHLRRRGMDGR